MTKFKYKQSLGSKRSRTHSFQKIAAALGTSVSSISAISNQAAITNESVTGNVWSGTVEPTNRGTAVVKLTATMSDGQVVIDTFETTVTTPTYAQIAGNSYGFDIQYG